MPSPTATHSSLENENDLVFFSQSKGLSSGRLREAINKKKCVNKEIVLICLDPLPPAPNHRRSCYRGNGDKSPP